MQRKKTIMIIEDEPTIRELLTRILELEGYATVSAGDGRAAIELLSEIEKPDLILVDNLMPVMSGTEFLKALADDHVMVTIPVAMVSAYSEPESVGHARAFIKKPIDLDALLKFVKEWCG